MNYYYLKDTPKGFNLSSEDLDEINNIRCNVQEIQKSTKFEELNINVEGFTNVHYRLSENNDFFGIFLDNLQIIGIPGSNGSFCLNFDGLYRVNS